MMANKRNLEYVDSLIRNKMPRLEKELNLTGSPNLSKPSHLTTYVHENPLKYTGTYLAYHLRNHDGPDLPGVWSHPPQYLTHITNPHMHPQPPSDCPQPNSHLYRVEPEGRPSANESAASEKRKVDLVKDLMNVRLKWVTFVERQENLRNGQNPAVLLHSSPRAKHHLVPTSAPLSPSRSCVNVAIPQPVYRNGACYPINGCSVTESPADRYCRNDPEKGDWRALPPANSSCLMAGDNQGLLQVRYSNLPPPRDNTSLPSETGPGHLSSAGRLHKEPRGMPPGYGAFSRTLLQDPRYPALTYESADGSGHMNAPTHSLQELQKISLQPYSLAEATRVQPTLYRDRSTPPKFPVPVQHKAVQGPSQPTSGHYSLQRQNYQLPADYPASGGRVPVPTALFTSRHNPGSFPLFPDNIRYLPPHYHILPQESSAPGRPPTTSTSTTPLNPPAYQLSDLERRAPSQAPHPSQRDECADNVKASSGNLLHFRPRVIIDAQKDQRCHRNPPESLPNEDLVAGQCQLLSKHSAFHPVVSASHVKGAGERAAPPPADRGAQEPAMKDPSASTCVPLRRDYDPSPLGKLRREFAKSKACVHDTLPPSYSVAITSRTVPGVRCSPVTEETKLKPPASPPMPIINNVFSLAPYQAYLEASGIFTKHLNCQLNQECTCSKEGKVSMSGDGSVDLRCEKCGSASNGLPSKIAGLPFEGARDPPETMGRQRPAGDSVSVTQRSSEFQEQALNFSVKHSGRLQHEGAPDNGERVSPRQPRSEYQRVDLQLTAAEKETEADTALDLSVRSKLRFVNAAWQSPALSSGFSSTSSPSAGAEQESTCPRPAAPAETQEVAAGFVSEGERPKSQEPLPAELGEKNSDEASDDASNSSHSRAIQLQLGDVNLKKYKKLRPTQAKPDEPTPAPPAEKVPGTIKFHSVDLLVPLSLKLRPLKLLLTDIPKSLLSHKQESTTSPSETKVPAPDNGESVPSDTQGYFMGLHQSLCSMVARSVTETSEDVLRLCLRSLDAEESQSTENPRLQSLPKSKNGVRNYELLKMSKSKEIWLQQESVQSALKRLLAHLETYLFTQRCPFPHVIRAGTIFIPIYLIKEKLFSNLEGVMIDQVFQEHKVELRPTTLSEEKKLQSELQLQRCSSRLIKLLSLKQLPNIYPDLLNVLWHSCLKAHLGEKVDEDLTEEVPPQAPGNPSNGDDIDKDQLSDPPLGEMGTNPQSVSDDSSRLQNEQDISVKASRLRVKGTKQRWKLAVPASVNPKKPRVGRGPQSARKVKVRAEKPSSVLSNGHTPVEEEEEEAAKTPQPSYRKLRKRKILLMAKDSSKPACEKTGSGLSLTKPVTPNGGEREARDSNPVKVCRVSIKNRNNTSADSLRPTRSTSKVLHLRSSIVRLRFQKSQRTSTYRTAVHKPTITRKTAPTSRNDPKALVKHREVVYPNLVGKRIRHLYEESDKSESWYKGLVVRLHEKHPNPLKTVYEVKYDSEPEWQYYLELLHDYAKGWVRVEV